MRKVGFIIHPLKTEHPYDIFGPEKWLLEKMIKPEIMKDAIRYSDPFKYVHLHNICSVTGSKIEGIVVIFPYFPAYLFKEDRETMINKLLNACKLAEKEGADLIVLSSFTSMFANEGRDIEKKLNVAVTSGENYLAATVIQGMEKAMSFMKIRRQGVTAAVLGATTNVGRVYSKILAGIFDEVSLYSPNANDLDELIDEIKDDGKPAEIIKTKDAGTAAKGAKVILVTASPYTIRLDRSILEPGSIVCDIAIPPQTAEDLAKERKDLLSFDGRFADMARGIENEKWHRMFPEGVIFSRLAEGIILCLEDNLVSYSLGKETITEEKVTKISQMAKKHGFSAADFRMGMNKFSPQYLNNIKRARHGITR